MDPRLILQQYMLARQNQPDDGDAMGTNPQQPMPASGGDMSPDMSPYMPPVPQQPAPPPPPPKPSQIFGLDMPETPQDVSSWDKKILFHKEPSIGTPPVTPSDDYSQQILNTLVAGQGAADRAVNSSANTDPAKLNALMQVLPGIANKAGSIGPNQPAVPDSSGIQRYFQLLGQLEQAKAQAPIQNNATQLKILQDLQAAKDKQKQSLISANGQAGKVQDQRDWEINTKLPAQTAAKATQAQTAQDIKSAAIGGDALNRNFANFYNTYVAQGGHSQDAKALANLNEAITSLKGNSKLSGGPLGQMGEWAAAIGDPARVDVQEKVKDAVKNSLKTILGGDFAAREGDQIFALAFNPKLPVEMNLPRVQKLFDSLKAQQQAKLDAIKYWERNNQSLNGYKSPLGQLVTPDDVIGQIKKDLGPMPNTSASNPPLKIKGETEKKIINGVPYYKDKDNLWYPAGGGK